MASARSAAYRSARSRSRRGSVLARLHQAASVTITSACIKRAQRDMPRTRVRYRSLADVSSVYGYWSGRALVPRALLGHAGARRRSRRCRVSRSGRSTRPRTSAPFEERIGFPGEYPFTRGVYPSMYRGRLWTMRQFAGFGTAEETNERFRYLLDHGQTGLSHRVRHAVADGPRLRPRALARRGRARGRGDRHARRHADAVRRHRPRRGHGVDDDQRAGGDHDGLLRGGGRGGRRAARRGWAGRSRPTSSRSTSPRRSGASRSIRRCACWGT